MKTFVGKSFGQSDICACNDGSIKLNAVGQCGRQDPSIPTYATWK